MAMNGEILTEIPNGIAVNILASAGASVSKVRGVHGGALKVAVRAAPEKGKANAEIEEVLAEFFGVSRKSVSVVGGVTSRNKRVEVAGVSMAAARERIGKG
ncbi:MAG TPA: DUF167 domain-containing protein [Planctomycetota bacterium]|nr:DUF167 domain-containing protein [Planctomycetota bacterium]